MRGSKARTIRKFLGAGRAKSYGLTNKRIKTVEVPIIPNEVDPLTGDLKMRDYTFITHTRIADHGRSGYQACKKWMRGLPMALIQQQQQTSQRSNSSA